METTNERNEHEQRTTPKVDAIVDLLRTQGQIWARYGLTLGKAALETNARALADLAGSLGKLADALAPKADADATEAKHDEAKDEPIES